MINETQQWYLNFCKDKNLNPKEAKSLEEYDKIVKPLKELRQKVVEKIKPICSAFEIYDYDFLVGYGNQCLKLNNVKINCTYNSEEAILNELIGYLFVTKYAEMNYIGNSEEVLETIKCKWKEVQYD